MRADQAAWALLALRRAGEYGEGMSYQAQTWVNLHAPYAAGAERAVLKELANSTNEESGMAWPGLERLSFSSGYCRRAVWSALQTMLRHGVIIQTGFRNSAATVANERGGRGLRRGFRIVMDKAKWTLDADAIAVAAERGAWFGRIEARNSKGAAIAPYRRRVRVQLLHGMVADTVQSETDKGATGLTNEGSHLLYEPSELNTRIEVETKRDADAEPSRDAVRELLASTLRKLALKAAMGI